MNIMLSKSARALQKRLKNAPIAAISFFGIAVTLVLLVIPTFALNLFSDVRPTFDINESIEIKKGDFGQATQKTWPKDTIYPGYYGDLRASAIFWLDEILPADGRIRGSVLVYIPDEFLSMLWDSSENDSVAYDNRIEPKPQYEDALFIIELSDAVSFSDKTIQVPLKEFFSMRANQHAYPFELELTGQPELYPSDWYQMGTFIRVVLPPNLYIRSGSRPSGYSLPLDAQVRLSSGMQGVRVQLMREYGNQTTVPYQRWVKLIFTRGGANMRYVYAISLIPLALAWLMSHLFIINRKYAIKSVNELLVGMTAVVLTELPLRMVLVPSNISELTRVDLILAVCVVAISAEMLIIYGIELMKARRRDIYCDGG